MARQLLIICLLLCCSSQLFAAEYSGSVSWIYDGDTLQVAGVGKVRLLGIDTPETKNSPRDNFYHREFGIGQKKLRTISRQAKKFAIKLAKGQQVKLTTDHVERDKHGRLLAYLYLPDGQLLNRLLLETGLATVFRRYKFSRKNDFLAAEKAARASKIGLWQQ